MHKILLAIAFFGLLLSGYLLMTYVSPVPLVCGPNGGCHAVRESTYAAFFGIPTPAYGVIFYFTLGILASLWDKKRQGYIYWGLIALTSAGFAVSAFLTYLEAFVIYAWCRWCVVSAVLATLALIPVWLHPKQEEI